MSCMWCPLEFNVMTLTNWSEYTSMQVGRIGDKRFAKPSACVMQFRGHAEGG